jgi:hypothetical protein
MDVLGHSSSRGFGPTKLTRAALVDVRQRCLRKRVWYRVLSPLERSLMSITIRVVDEVRSNRLTRLIGTILDKLERALENRFLAQVLERGRILASRMAEIAYSWGYGSALDWTRDRAYILYLGVCQIGAGHCFGNGP